MTVLVVGAGAAGLGAATALAARGPVTVIDRIPVPGGTAGYERADVRAAVGAAERAGVELRLGATATRWEDGRLLVCAPGAIGWHPGTALVFAGGMRPPTPAELGLAGDRPAGVLPVSVATHLLEADPALWRRAAIVGAGPGAEEAAARIVAGGGAVVRVPAGELAVEGRAHVTAIRAGARRIACDAVLLAGDERPVRNVEGAVADGAAGVRHLQDLPAADFAGTVRLAAEAVAP